jgi:hypothetical protein
MTATSEEPGQLFEWVDEDSGFSVVIEEADGTCHAYLLDNGEIDTDVWLFDSDDARLEAEWAGLKDIENVVNVVWDDGDGGMRAEIFVGETLFAVLEAGVTPGQSLFAHEDGALARRLRGNAS